MRALAPGLFLGSEFSPDKRIPHSWIPGLKNETWGTLRFTLPHFLKSLGDQCAYDVFQVAEAGGDAFYWWDFGGAEFYVLFYYQPAGIGVLL
jgi:hypothetical protein